MPSLLLVSLLCAGVEPSGSYSSAVRFTVPQFYGLEPALGLVYNSSSGMGLAGRDWHLSGVSEIVRHSPGRGAPKFDTSDVFYLDGEELVPCAGVTWAPSCTATGSDGLTGTHATKRQDFRKIQQV